MTPILNGMRVVEGSAFVAVPLAGMNLAQMGADVIRFDHIEGDGFQSLAACTKRRKSFLGRNEQGEKRRKLALSPVKWAPYHNRCRRYGSPVGLLFCLTGNAFVAVSGLSWSRSDC